MLGHSKIVHTLHLEYRGQRCHQRIEMRCVCVRRLVRSLLSFKCPLSYRYLIPNPGFSGENSRSIATR
ncbi:Hypothetical predicted protein [Octopus vulgaris]|uniref:Uncharacterized protein n=1 Tax=Octopus vulgaris TaxID=6645 RepID=A0AA36AKB0_OCTVU|nr:Hypothetical predicted protein [Octopus vulgaris]